MLTDDDRQLFSSIADILIPDAEGMPSATQAAVPERYLDEALGYRPDLADGLRAALDAARGMEPQDAVEHLNTEHIPAFEALGTLLAGAYFLNPDVRDLIGYPGQVPTPPKDDLESYVDLLENVLNRGQVYREVPSEAG